MLGLLVLCVCLCASLSLSLWMSSNEEWITDITDRKLYFLEYTLRRYIARYNFLHIAFNLSIHQSAPATHAYTNNYYCSV